MQYREVINLDKINNKETITKTIRMEPDLIEKIEKLAEASERDFTKQVKFMLREYIRSREMKWPAGDNPPAGLVYIMQFPLNHRLAKYKISLSLFPLAKLPLFLIPNGYVPPFAEIRRFFKIKICRSSLQLFL